MKIIKKIHIRLWASMILICLAAASTASGSTDPCEPGGASGLDGAPTIAAEVELPTELFPDLEWDPENPTVIERSSHVVIRVIGGAPPYEFSVQEDDYWLDEDKTISTLVTESNEIILYAGSECTQDATVFVTDALGATVHGVLELVMTTVVLLEFKTTGHSLSIVWSPQKNGYANHIPKNDGGVAVFPCDSDSISEWRYGSGTVNVGYTLFSNNRCGVQHSRFFVGAIPCNSSGDSEECSGQYRKDIWCRDVNGGEQFETGVAAGIANESYVHSNRSGRTPAWYGWSGDPDMQGRFLYGPSNRSLYAKNTGSYTSFAVSYSFERKIDFEFDDDLALYTSEVAVTERLVVESPLGVLGEMDLQEYDYVSSFEHEGMKHQKGIIDWKTFHTGAYSDNTLCQIFGLEVMVEERNWACGQVFNYWYFYPDNCQSAVGGGEKISEVYASCKTGVNAHVTEPVDVGRNLAFEAGGRGWR